MLEKRAKTSQPIADIIAKRWSPRAFDPDKFVTKEQIVSLCEAARWAPSCFGDEPWRMIVWDKNSDPEYYQKAFDCLDPWNQKWIKNTPVLIGVFCYDNFRVNHKPNRWSEFDTGAACQNLYLQAVELGLISHPMGGYDEKKIKEIFEVPEDYSSVAMIAIGYQAEPEVLEESYREIEVKERKRRAIGTEFFNSKWENPIDG